MKFLKLAVLSLLLAGVLIIPNASAKGENVQWCYDCDSAIQTGKGYCYLDHFDWEEYRCVYETDCDPMGGPIPYIITFCE